MGLKKISSMLMPGLLLLLADSDSLAISSPTLVAAAVMMSRFPAYGGR